MSQWVDSILGVGTIWPGWGCALTRLRSHRVMVLQVDRIWPSDQGRPSKQLKILVYVCNIFH